MLAQLWSWLLAASPLAVLAAFALAFLAVLLVLQQIRPDDDRAPLAARLGNLRKNLGVPGVPLWLVAVATVVWTAILVLLLYGVLFLIWTMLAEAPPQDESAAWDFRFLLAQLAAITAVLGAVVAFPVTLNRLRLATEENATKADALFNDKINAALADLHAQRQVTIEEDGKSVSVWQDDIIRRNGAIDRLEALAHENPAMAPRIARMLATYLREMSAVFPAKDPPAGATPKDLRDWANSLEPARSDMENAAQTLGRLREVEGMTPEKLKIDLHGANLQGFRLHNARFESANFNMARMEGASHREAHLEGADLVEAHLEGADLAEARLEGSHLSEAHFEEAHLFGAHLERADLFLACLEGAILSGAKFDPATDLTGAFTSSAAVSAVDLSNVDLSQDQINAMFGDGSVILPDGIPCPKHWPSEVLDYHTFLREWHLYKSNPAAYVPPQDRPDSDHS